MRRLVLLRHAKSAWPVGVGDHERPLNDRGLRDAAAAGRILAADGPRPDLVLCSDATRTRQTWDLVAAGLADPQAEPVTVRVEARVYEATTQSLLTLLREQEDDIRTLLVLGHEPTMSELTLLLSGSGSAPAALDQVRTKYPTCGMAVLRVETPWRSLGSGAAALERFVVPRGFDVG